MHPVLFEIAGRQVASFGVMLTVGVLVGIWLSLAAFERAGLDSRRGLFVMMASVVVAVVASRAWWALEMVARNEDLTLADVGSLMVAPEGGLTWYGALLGALTVGVIGGWITGIPIRPGLDAVAPGVAFGQAIGRLGCFMVGDDYGRVTDSWVGIAFPEGVPPTVAPVHTTQLYEMVWLLGVGAWLWKRKATSSSAFAEYLMLAGAGRFLIELFRTNPAVAGPFSNAQVVAMVAVGVGAWLRAGRPT